MRDNKLDGIQTPPFRLSGSCATPAPPLPHHGPMKKLTIQTAADTLTVTAHEPHGLGTAMTAQDPNHGLRLEDGSTLHLNCRQVIAWSEEDAGDEADAQPEAEPSKPAQKMVPDPDPEHDPDRTVAQLKEALDGAGVEYPSGAVKADLQKLAVDSGV